MFERIEEMLKDIQLFEDFHPKTPPDNYVIFTDRRQTSTYADGKPFFNIHNCVLDVFEMKFNKKQLAKQIEEILLQNEINFVRINVGYLVDLKKTQITFEFNLI